MFAQLLLWASSPRSITIVNPVKHITKNPGLSTFDNLDLGVRVLTGIGANHEWLLIAGPTAKNPSSQLKTFNHWAISPSWAPHPKC